MDTTSNSSHEEQPLKDCQSISLGLIITRFLLLVPLCTFILYQAFQQWRQHHSFSTTSHSDLFTFHNAVMEIFWSVGSVIGCLHYVIHAHWLVHASTAFTFLSYFGQSFFHMLMCVERYLAVVHPVTFRGLKTSRGVRIRDATISCVWLLCFVVGFVLQFDDDTSDLVSFFIMSGISLVVCSFCSVSVLSILIRPRPGDGGRDRQRIDQSKLRAFFTITAILGTLWFWFLPFVVGTALYTVFLGDVYVECVIQASAYWFSVPSSLVLPLLYLHRTGRLAFCPSRG